MAFEMWKRAIIHLHAQIGKAKKMNRNRGSRELNDVTNGD